MTAAEKQGIGEGLLIGLTLALAAVAVMVLLGTWGLAVYVVLMMAGFIKASW